MRNAQSTQLLKAAIYLAGAHHIRETGGLVPLATVLDEKARTELQDVLASEFGCTTYEVQQRIESELGRLLKGPLLQTHRRAA